MDKIQNNDIENLDEAESLKEKEDTDPEIELNKYDSDDSKSESSESSSKEDEQIISTEQIQNDQKEVEEEETDPHIYLEQIYQIFTEEAYPKLNKDLLNNVANYLRTFKNVRGLLLHFNINSNDLNDCANYIKLLDTFECLNDGGI